MSSLESKFQKDLHMSNHRPSFDVLRSKSRDLSGKVTVKDGKSDGEQDISKIDKGAKNNLEEMDSKGRNLENKVQNNNYSHKNFKNLTGELLTDEFVIETAKKSPHYRDLPEDAFAQAEAAFQKVKMEMCEKYAKEKNMEVEEYIKKIDENAKQMLLSMDTKICIRLRSARTLLNILKNEFKTIHEKGIYIKNAEKFVDDLAKRLTVEQIMHNHDPKKTNPNTYRVCGYVTNKEDGEGVHSLGEKILGDRYGKVAIILKDKVKERAWVGFDDTLEQIRFVDKERGESTIYQEGRTIKKTMKLVPFLHPNSDAFAWKTMDPDDRLYLWHDKGKSPLECKTLADLPSFYTEAHIARNETTSSGESRKPLGVEDIGRVVFRGKSLKITDKQGRRDPQLLEELMTELSQRGIAWSVTKGLSLKEVFGDLTDVAKRYSSDYMDAKRKLKDLKSAYRDVTQYGLFHRDKTESNIIAEEINNKKNFGKIQKKINIEEFLRKIRKKVNNDEKYLEECKNLQQESKNIEEYTRMLLNILERIKLVMGHSRRMAQSKL